MDTLNSSGERLCICLFGFKSENRHDYRKLLDSFNVRIIDIEKEEHFQVFFESVKINGILIDIPTYIKSSEETKNFISNLNSIYPSARIRYNKAISGVELFISGEMHAVPLQEFLNRCCFFPARKIRRYKRIPCNLNVRIAFEHEGKPVEILCSSADISEDGMFVIILTENLPLGANVKIQVFELGKDGFLHGIVMRSLEWGEKMFHAPGYGIRISSVDKEVFADYMALIQKR